MSSRADLFVVCKHCGAEVSPYITECPYCGQRLRRRAPKIPRQTTRPQARGGLLGRLGRGRAARRRPRLAPGALTSSPSGLARALASLRGGYGVRPYATIAIVAASCVGWVILRGGFLAADKLVIVGPLKGEWWKLLGSPLAYLNGVYAFISLLAVAIFGWLLERRLGAAFVLALFFGASAAGALVALAVYPVAVVSGGNAGALALLAAWAMPDLRAARAGHYYEGDLLGAAALAAILLAIPFALTLPEAPNWLAGVTGGALGTVVGLGVHRLERDGA